MTRSIERLLSYQIEARHTPGAVVHVERAGKVLAHCVAGRLDSGRDLPMRDDALFRLASLSKAIVSVAALTQVDQGLLALDAPVADYLPPLDGLRMKSGARPQRAPTVRDLLRHTAALPYEWDIADQDLRAAALQSDLAARLPLLSAETLLDTLARRPLAQQPGTAFRYGYATDLLGMIVAKLDRVSLGTALARRIFDPLGMTETGFEVPPAAQPRLASAFAEDAAWHARVAAYGIHRADRPWMESGGGGLVATLGDYARFARMLANAGAIGSERLLSPELFAEMGRNQLAGDDDGPLAFTGAGFGFGLGLAVRLDRGPAAMPCVAGELAWSGISGTALFVHPGEQWFALAFTSNMTSRMMARMEFRRAVASLF